MTNKIKTAIKLLVTLAILAYLLDAIPFHRVVESILSVSKLFFALSICAMVGVQVLGAYEIKILARHQKINLTTYQIFRITMISRFYGLFLPGYLSGGVIRWYLVAKPFNQKVEAAAVILFNRIVETLVIVVLGVVFWLLDKKSHLVLGGSYQWLFLLPIGLIIMYFLIFSEFVRRRISIRVPQRHVSFLLKKFIVSVGQAVKHFNHMKRSVYVKFLLMCLLRQLIGVISVLCLAIGLGIEVTYIELGWIRSIINILVMFPFTISGLGIREAAFVYFLQFYGVASYEALALSLLVFVVGLLFSLIGGCYELKNHFLRISNDRLRS